jgi:predicted nucleic acid-binding protein
VRAVADTGPVNYLVLIGRIDLVPQLFGSLSIPTVVRDELDDPMTPAAVRRWIAAPPGWLTIMPLPAEADFAPASLDDGERAAIALATAIKADLLLMDDRAGVAAARAQGIEVTGTLGVLDRAARHGLIDLSAAFSALQATNFHARQDLLDVLLRRDRERRSQP